jgi:hypothetical protein
LRRDSNPRGGPLANPFGVNSDEQRETHCDDDDTARIVTRATVMRIVDRAEKVLRKEAQARHRRAASAAVLLRRQAEAVDAARQAPRRLTD